MRTALDAPAATLDEDEQTFIAKIREFGWFRTGVLGEDEQPGFAYTTGFWSSLGAPEILVFSLKLEIAHNVLWDIYREARDGRSLPIGQAIGDIFGNHMAYLFPVAKEHYAEHVGWSRWFYGDDDFPCVQLVWPDRNGVFPWQADFDESFRDDQPDLSPTGWVSELRH
jgi:hypothetical protein